MTKKEQIRKNIRLTFQFIKYLIDHPKEVEKIPNHSEIIFLEDEFPITIHDKVKYETNKTICYEVNRTFHPVAINF